VDDLVITIGPLSLTQQQFAPGDTVRVTVSFSYTVGADTTVTLKAGPYNPSVWGKDMIDSCVGSADVSLPRAPTLTAITATVDFHLVPKAQGGIDDGTYGLAVWIDGTDAEAEQESVIVVSGNPQGGLSGIADTLSTMMPMMMMGMMMMMIMPMSQGAFGQGEETGEKKK
jgi:hypothetical protein